jgi:hypothetical protein
MDAVQPMAPVLGLWLELGLLLVAQLPVPHFHLQLRPPANFDRLWN